AAPTWTRTPSAARSDGRERGTRAGRDEPMDLTVWSAAVPATRTWWVGRPIEARHARADHRSVEHADEIEICRTDIALGGFSVAAIIADETGCDWAYSIGLHHSFGHPELLL